MSEYDNDDDVKCVFSPLLLSQAVRRITADSAKRSTQQAAMAGERAYELGVVHKKVCPTCDCVQRYLWREH